MSRRAARWARLLAGGVVGAAALGGCGVPDLAALPLPGGAPAGPSYRVTVEFADALDLVPQAAVKVNDVTVGSVEEISLAGWTARVRLRIDRAVRLPANATAGVRQTSLLGEKYVALTAPDTSAAGQLAVGELADGQLADGQLTDGAVIPLSRTARSAEVEEVLAALGLLLNGGGLVQLQTINRELAAALTGREETAREALRQLDEFVGGLDQQRADLVRAVEALDRLTDRLARQRAVIGDALDALDPGLTVLAEQRAQLTAAVKALGELGRVGSRVVTTSRADTVANLRSLEPILARLAEAGDDLPRSVEFLLTYPFPPNVTGAIVGDYVNLSVTADLDAATILSNLLATAPGQPAGSAGRPPGSGPGEPGGPDRPGRPERPSSGGDGLLPGVLPEVCLPTGGLLPPGWVPPLLPECELPEGCELLPPGSDPPRGGLLPPGGVVPPGTVLPPGTRLPVGTILTPGCLLPATGAIDGLIGDLGDLLGGGPLR